MRRTITTLTTTLAAMALTMGVAVADAGPSYATIDALDGVYACGGQTDAEGALVTPPDDGAPVPPNHCINVRSQGSTGLILVFPPDNRGPAEGISGNPKVADRPCPNDPGSPDGTWWQPTGPDGEPLPFWVCHRKP